MLNAKNAKLRAGATYLIPPDAVMPAGYEIRIGTTQFDDGTMNAGTWAIIQFWDEAGRRDVKFVKRGTRR